MRKTIILTKFISIPADLIFTFTADVPKDDPRWEQTALYWLGWKKWILVGRGGTNTRWKKHNPLINRRWGIRLITLSPKEAQQFFRAHGPAKRFEAWKDNFEGDEVLNLQMLVEF